jgi:hypothetical protein
MRRGPVFALALAVTPATPLHGQVRASEQATVSQTIAGTVITIEYHRPSMRGRDAIFGAQVAWGAIWTPGANNVTTLAATRPIRLADHAVPAGRYGVWLEIRRDSAWILYLHPDTARWHLPPPPRAEMVHAVPVRVRAADAFRETLSWEFERVRATGAELRLWWGRTLVAVDLAVDAGVRLTVDEATGRLYEGTWTETGVRANARPREVTVRYDRERRQLTAVDTTLTAENTPTTTWTWLLMPRAEGVFVRGYALNGELVMAGAAGQQSYLEFAFEHGRPVRYVVRNPRDSVVARGERR